MSAKPNKPQNVIRHEHLWASPAHEEAEAGRLDVCLLANGEAVVWDVDRDEVMRAGNLRLEQPWTWEKALAEGRWYADARADLTRDRWVRIMCDFSADPLWERGGAMAEVEDLPVSLEIRNRLRVWWVSYEDHGGFMPEPGQPPVDPDALQSFSAEGLAIAQAVKAALPDWTVVYHDEGTHLTQPDAPRSVWEYEIAG